jgi:D-sedoheptulose 7-phosphate isomerase
MLATAPIEDRVACGERYFGAEAGRIARLCHAMAERFARGGRLIAFGATPADTSDVRHVTVEFVHPVIVGKRALPALGLACEDVALVARPDDIAMAFGDAAPVREALSAATALGCLTVAFAPVGAQWELRVPTRDPFVAQEQVETTYHVLWELVHVFFEHRGLLEGRDARPHHDSGASAFLYPFLAEAEADLDAVLADVAASVVAKAALAGAMRAETLAGSSAALEAAAGALRECFAHGGTALALGNGGSATDAMDAVADLRHPPAPWPAHPALDLTEDAPVLTAIANDIGVEAMFARQVIAHGHAGDVLLTFSTSGNSPNVLAALAEGRRRDLATVAFVGYGGGRIAAEALADHIVVTPCEHIPRIQEAQASAWHVLRELIETPG